MPRDVDLVEHYAITYGRGNGGGGGNSRPSEERPTNGAAGNDKERI